MKMRLNVSKTSLKFLSTIQSLFTWIFYVSCPIYIYIKHNFERQYEIINISHQSIDSKYRTPYYPKSMTHPHASMSIPRRSITISHSSMTLPHSSMTLGQASISFPHSSIILSQKSITFPHSPISLPHKSMALPHSPKYGCFKRMRTCFTLISRKTGAIFSLSFFRQYKVCFI